MASLRDRRHPSPACRSRPLTALPRPRRRPGLRTSPRYWTRRPRSSSNCPPPASPLRIGDVPELGGGQLNLLASAVRDIVEAAQRATDGRYRDARCGGDVLNRDAANVGHGASVAQASVRSQVLRLRTGAFPVPSAPTRDVAQLSSAPALGAGGRGFKSRRPDENSLSEYVFLYLTRSRRSQIRPREPQGNTRNDEPNGNDPPTTSCTPLLAPPLSRGAGQVSRTV